MLRVLSALIIFGSPFGWYLFAFREPHCVFLHEVIIFGASLGMAFTYSLFLLDEVCGRKK